MSRTPIQDPHALENPRVVHRNGTGYSSLSFIQTFPLTRIKIDQSFVRGLGDDPQSIAIVRAVVSLSESLGLAVSAEGIETKDRDQAGLP